MPWLKGGFIKALLWGFIIPAAALWFDESAPRVWGQTSQTNLPSPNLPWLTNVEQIRRLTVGEADRQHPVLITGVVTCSDPDWNLLFIQDATGGIYLSALDQGLRLVAGQIAEVEGITDQGLFGPYVCRTRVKPGAMGALPTAKPVALAQLMAGTEDGQWVEVTGWVNSAGEQGDHAILRVEIDGREIKIIISGLAPDKAGKLLDTRVRLRGVCIVISNQPRQVEDVQIVVPGWEEFVVLGKRPPDAFALPVRSIQELTALPASQGEDSVRIQGVVTQWDPGKWLRVRDRTGTVQVQSAQTNRLTNDMFVDVVGKPARDGGTPKMMRGQYRRLGSGLGSTPEELGQFYRPSAAGVPSQILRRAEIIRRLDAKSAEQGLPVVLRGVISYYEPIDNNCFVQDETAGIWVDTQSSDSYELDIEPGTLVEVEAYTRPGFAPSLVKPRFQVLGRSPLPKADQVTLPRLLTGKEDSQWVKVVGRVRSVKTEDNLFVLGLEMDHGGLLKAYLPVSCAPAAPKYLEAAFVQVQGVCVTVPNAKQQLIGVQLLVPSTNQITIMKAAAADPFAISVNPIQELMRFRAQGLEESRVRVRGVVTLMRSNRSLFIQEGTNGLCVELQEPQARAVGDLVDVVGFPSIGDFTPILRNALCRRCGTGPTPLASPARAEEASSGSHDAELVQMEALFLEQTTRMKEDRVLTLRAGERVFNAVIEQAKCGRQLDGLRLGTPVRLTGVCSVQVDDNRQPTSFRLLLRGPEDVRVLGATGAWLSAHAYRLLGLLSVVSLSALGWVVLLRRRVQEQTKLVRQRLIQEAALEDRYRELFENASDLIFTLDFTGRFTALNRATERALGHTKAELLTRSIFDLLVPAHQDRLRELIRQMCAAETSQTAEFELVNRHQQRLELEVGVRLLHHEGQRAGLDCIARDVTERRRAENELRESQVNLAVAQRIAHLGSWESGLANLDDLERNPLRWSDETFRIFGYEPGRVEVSKQLFLQAVHPEDRPRLQASVREAIRQRRSYQLEHRIRRLDGTERIVHEQAEIVLDPGTGQPVKLVGTVQDITDRKETEAERTQLEAQLRQAQKLEAIGTLAGGIAHDFNNILGAIIGYTELAKEDTRDKAEALDSLDNVLQASARAKELVKQILAFSRQTKQERKPTALQLVVKEALQLLRSTLPATIEMAGDIGRALPLVLADPTQIHQVVMNLCTNAAHAMRGQVGRLVVRLESFEVDASFARLHPDLHAGPHVKLTVSDTGHGMDSETMNRIFLPFFTTKGPGEGTGLGLAVVHGIVKDHQGAIDVASRPGQGTVFRLCFPAIEAEGGQEERIPKQVTLGHGERVLFVDDEPALCKVGASLMKRLGYRATAEANPRAALELFQAQPREFDLVLTDLTMPGMTGIDLAAAVLRTRPEIPVLLATGLFTSETMAKAQSLGIRDTILKPFNQVLLADALHKALQA